MIFFIILQSNSIFTHPLYPHKMVPSFYLRLYQWYESEKRILPWRETMDPYKIWLSEIILQQTRVAQGMSYYMRMTERFPDVSSLAQADEDEVMLYWQGLGYYSRARNLHKAAKLICEQSADHSFPGTFESIRKLPGVGEYTAGAIASFAYNLPYPAMDGNVYRVIARLHDCDMAFDTSAGKKYFHRLAAEMLDTERPRLFNSAIMEFGALYCTPTSPDCQQCPIRTFCLAAEHHTVELLPVRKPRPTLRDRYLNYTIYIYNKETLIHRREANDIWKHLWEFPLIETDKPQPKQKGQIEITHILSHQRLHARFQLIKTDALPHIEGTIAIPIEELDNYAMSRLTLKALEGLRVKGER